MKVVVAPAPFKGSLSAAAAAEALAAGLRAALPAAEVVALPVADGGEGTVEALAASTGGALHGVEVTGPLGERRTARYGLLGDGETIAVEVAEASGLILVPPERRDPRRTTTRGTGELIARAVAAHGARRVLIGLGGSATCDAGAGLAQALGARLLDEGGADLPPGGAALARLARIDVSALQDLEVTAACDVTNPLCGPEGAAAVYGPQKGATPQAVAELDRALARFAEVARRDLGREVAEVPGAGAAGGLGAGLLALFGASLRPGAALVLDAIGFDAALEGADLVVTGEGRLDRQTLSGKAPAGVLERARARGVPVLAVGGGLDPAAIDALHAAGFAALIPAVDGPSTVEQAMAQAAALLRRAGERVGRLLRLSEGARLGVVFSPAPARRAPARLDPGTSG